jgi:hypothetical protein
MIYQRKIFLPIGASTFRGDTHLVAQAASSFNSADSYNGDDARRFHRHREWNVAVDRYSEVT